MGERLVLPACEIGVLDDGQVVIYWTPVEGVDYRPTVTKLCELLHLTPREYIETKADSEIIALKREIEDLKVFLREVGEYIGTDANAVKLASHAVFKDRFTWILEK